MKKPERQTYFFAIVREHGGQGQPGRSLQLSLFIRLRKYRSEAGCCQDGSARIMSQKCNLKTYNALQPIPDLENHETWAPDTGRLERSFVIIGLRRNPPEWRYRLGVRTEDSQSSNPGSIPGSATSPPLLADSKRDAESPNSLVVVF